jgi:uroporphyrinogen decarboxylase
MMEAELSAFRRFPDISFIPGVMPDYGDAILLPSALGAGPIYWQEETLPAIRNPLIRQDSDLDRLHDPDPFHDGFLAWYMRALRRFVESSEDFADHLHFIKSIGPGELAQHIWNMTDLLMSLVTEPDFCHRLLDKLTTAIIRFYEAQLEVKPHAEGLVLSDDVGGLVSEKTYRQMLFPCHRRIRDHFADKIMLFHCDTQAEHVLKAFADLDIQILNFGHTTDIRKVKLAIGDRVVLMGNVDPLGVLQQGTTEDVRRAAQECVEIGKARGGFILSASGGVNYGTPLENIDMLVEVAKENNFLWQG